MIIQLTPFGKGSSIAVRFSSLLIFMVSLRAFSRSFIPPSLILLLEIRSLRNQHLSEFR